MAAERAKVHSGWCVQGNDETNARRGQPTNFLAGRRLGLAAAAGDNKLIRRLHKDCKTYVNAQSSGMTPLHHAAKNDHISTMLLLSELGADVDDKLHGKKPITIARVLNHTKSVEVLTCLKEYKDAASAGCDMVELYVYSSGNVLSPKHWARYLPETLQLEFFNYVLVEAQNQRNCYMLLYAAPAGSTFRDAVFHDGHRHLQHLLSSYLVHKNEVRKVFGEIETFVLSIMADAEGEKATKKQQGKKRRDESNGAMTHRLPHNMHH